MPRFKFAGAAALMMAMAGVQARAAAPTLPPDVVAADTIVVVHVDAEHFNPDSLQAAATAVLGANANKVDEPLKKFKEQYDKAAAAGVVALTMVAGTDKKADADPAKAEGGPGNGIIYLQLKPGADVKAIEALITDQMKPEEKAKAVFDQAGDYLAVHQKDQDFPVKPDAARAAVFTSALATVGDASIQLAFIPDEKTRGEMLKQADSAPKGMKEAAPLIAKSQWITLGITFGNSPNLAVAVNAAVEADGKTIAGAINASLDDAKAQAANPGPNAGIMALAGPLIGQLIDGVRPVQNGSLVTVTVKTESLKMIATTAASLGVLGGPGGPPPGQ